MGDRANVKIVYTNGSKIYFYTHWGGEVLPNKVAKAIQRNQRWDDEAYLARIIFCQMISAEQHDAETGFGISPYICDNNRPIIVVDMGKQTVRFEKENGHSMSENISFGDISNKGLKYP